MAHVSFARFLAVPVLLIAFAGCDDGEPVGPVAPFNLTFRGDASFQGAHGGQEIRVALEGAGGEVVASEAATVSATSDPAFSFSFVDVLEEGQSYELKYWIDSNFGGGTAGVCDPPATDHQWSVAIVPANDDVTVTDMHRPGETESVCATFAFDLVFTGDASFQGAHGGQDLTASVVRAPSGLPGGALVVATAATVVSASEDPSFSLSFPDLLVLDDEYEIHYWIDSNFGGGSVGTCDPPANDHQWAIDIGAVDGDVTTSDTHRPGETESVCSTFPSPPPMTADVAVGDNFFEPSSQRIAAGGTVTWTWQGSIAHNVTFSTAPSSATQVAGTFDRTFPTEGSYDYLCTIHGAAMSGTIVVE